MPTPIPDASNSPTCKDAGDRPESRHSDEFPPLKSPVHATPPGEHWIWSFSGDARGGCTPPNQVVEDTSLSRQGLSTFEAVSSTQLMTAGPVNGSEVEVDELGERPESTRDIKEALELAPSTPTHKARWIKHTLPSGLVIEVEDKGRNGPAGTQSWSINHPTAHSTRASKAPCIQTTPDDEDSYLADIDDDIDFEIYEDAYPVDWRTNLPRQGGDIYWERRMLGLDSDEEVVDSDQE